MRPKTAERRVLNGVTNELMNFGLINATILLSKLTR
jgi:hypothetical protein